MELLDSLNTASFLVTQPAATAAAEEEEEEEEPPPLTLQARPQTT